MINWATFLYEALKMYQFYIQVQTHGNIMFTICNIYYVFNSLNFKIKTFQLEFRY